ncbi:MAG TPA: hypothetical protein VN636_02310 [Acidimicrobiia bacterium]|nr:hypothetical protein [Acidimicrobiia bacterium]
MWDGELMLDATDREWVISERRAGGGCVPLLLMTDEREANHVAIALRASGLDVTLGLRFPEELLAVQPQRVGADAWSVNRDVAPVVAAEVLVRHGLADDHIIDYLARTWELDETDCVAAVAAARAASALVTGRRHRA